jgi:hypothetical protein
MLRSICALTAVAAAALPASADIIQFNFGLDGLQEVPPVTTPGFGLATVTLNTVTGDVSVSGTFQDLLANVQAAHIHGLAPVGVNAGVILGLQLTGTTTGTISGMGTLTAAQVQGMIEGRTYINVHTTQHPGGEIRGQVVPAPGAVAMLGAVGLMAARRRRNG